MSLGALNPCALRLGGGKTRTEVLYRFLRSAIGEKGPGPKGGVEDAWRTAKAYGIARATVLQERAVVNAFPGRANDAIAAWEVLLGSEKSPDDPYQERVDELSVLYAGPIAVAIPGLQESLEAIDPNLSIITPVPTASADTHLGIHRASAGVDVDNAIQYVNFSSSYIMLVQWSGVGSSGFPEPQATLVARLLNKILPAWMEWGLVNDTTFYLDGFSDSYLDITAPGP